MIVNNLPMNGSPTWSGRLSCTGIIHNSFKNAGLRIALVMLVKESRLTAHTVEITYKSDKYMRAGRTEFYEYLRVIGFNPGIDGTRTFDCRGLDPERVIRVFTTWRCYFNTVFGRRQVLDDKITIFIRRHHKAIDTVVGR